MALKWTPPPGFATLEFNGKTYTPGDMVPISKAAAEHMMRHTAHVFEGVEAPDQPTPPPTAVTPQAPARGE